MVVVVYVTEEKREMPKAKNKQKQKAEQNNGLNRDLNPGPVTFGSRCFPTTRETRSDNHTTRPLSQR